jgi:hypothetical protein
MKALICFSEAAYQNVKMVEECLYLLVFSEIDAIKGDSRHIYTPIEPIDNAECVQQYTESVLESDLNILNAFLNNGYYYGVATIAGVCSYIKAVLTEYNITSVELHGAPSGKYMPIYFTAWGESSKNILTSGDCLYEYVAESLQGSHEIKLIESSFVSKLLRKSKRGVRYFLVPLICFVYSLRKLRLKRSKLSLPNNLSVGGPKNFFIVRTQHQLNVAQNVIASLGLKPEDVVLVEMESLSSVGLVDSLRQSGYRVLSPYSGLAGLVLSSVSLVRTYFWVIRIRMNEIVSRFSFEGVDYQLKDIMLDAAIQPQIFIYESLINKLSRSLGDSFRSKVFSFEQVSPQAYYDNKALNHAADVFFVKSTLIQNIHMPCICWGDRFLVNDKSELSLSDYSYLNGTSVTYNGSPKYSAILNLKKTLPKNAQCVLFATQPHEPDVNRLIIDTLTKIGAEQGFVTVVRKLPRDKAIYQDDSKQLVFDSRAGLYQQLADADLVIARTSTILEECIYIGVPYLSCLLSEKDCAYSAEYLDTASGLVLNSLEQLGIELEAYDKLVSRYKKWRNSYLVDFQYFSIDNINNPIV